MDEYVSRERFFELVGRTVNNFYNSSGDWLDAFDAALKSLTDCQIIKMSLWEETLAKLAETDGNKEPEPIEVVVSRGRDHTVKVVKPDHVRVEYRDYNMGDDCALCGTYELSRSLKRVIYGPGDSTITVKRILVCERCFAERYQEDFKD